MRKILSSARGFSNLLAAGLLGLVVLACDQPTATVNDLGKPLPTQAASTPVPNQPTPTPPKVDPRRTDLARVVVGKMAPDFVLEDLDRHKVRLSDLRGKQNVVLVFYRGFF